MKEHETLLNTFGGGGNLSKSSFLESLSSTHVADQAARLGFTLAEVLVTLGIIGVVSAMTLPTLVKNHQRQVYVTQLQKVVTELSQAVETAIEEHHAVTLSETPYTSSPLEFLRRYFKVVQTCTSSRTPCFANEYKNLDGTVFNKWRFRVDANNPCVSLASGAAICLDSTLGSDSYSNGEYTLHGSYCMYIDVNGSQGPNIVGRDLFSADLYSDGKVAEGYVSSWADSCGDSNANYGSGCLSKIMDDGWKMDY